VRGRKKTGIHQAWPEKRGGNIQDTPKGKVVQTRVFGVPEKENLYSSLSSYLKRACASVGEPERKEGPKQALAGV